MYSTYSVRFYFFLVRSMFGLTMNDVAVSARNVALSMPSSRSTPSSTRTYPLLKASDMVILRLDHSQTSNPMPAPAVRRKTRRVGNSVSYRIRRRRRRVSCPLTRPRETNGGFSDGVSSGGFACKWCEGCIGSDDWPGSEERAA
jgi:hypothetical protein